MSNINCSFPSFTAFIRSKIVSGLINVWPLLDVREKQIIRRKVTLAKHILPHQLLLSLFISLQKKKMSIFSQDCDKNVM